MTEEELIEFLVAFLPEGFGGWMGTVMAISAVLSFILPQPSEDAHPLWKIGHRTICILGLGASKIKAAGKLVGALASIRKGGGKA